MKAIKSADGHEIKKGRLFWYVAFHSETGPGVRRVKIQNVDSSGYIVLDAKVWQISGFRGMGHNLQYVANPSYLFHNEDVAKAAIAMYFEGKRLSINDRERKMLRRFASEKRRLKNKRK